MFEGDYKLVFHLAPPLLAKPDPRTGEPAKMQFGGWVLGLFRVLAGLKGLRGTALDLFGRTEERRMERALIDAYEARIGELLPQLDAARLPLATLIARVPLAMRGFGHVKLANVTLARTREAELLHRFDARRYPRPEGAPAAGQLKGIAVVAERA
jgi:indolepyruvate ferredoxin oxidoreductase